MARQRSATAVAVSLALLTTGEHAVAQGGRTLETRLQAGAAGSSRTSALGRDAMAVTPSLRYESSHLKATSAVGARLIDNRWQVGDAELTAEAYTPSFRGLRGEVIAGGSRVFVDDAGASQQLDLTGRLHL